MTQTIGQILSTMFKFNNMQYLLLVPICSQVLRIYCKEQMLNLQSFNIGYMALLAWKCIKV